MSFKKKVLPGELVFIARKGLSAIQVKRFICRELKCRMTHVERLACKQSPVGTIAPGSINTSIIIKRWH
ncbi:hypothetical protein AW734_07310 [Pantoea ananatis]|nr:hypothetical protein AW734_07310 [Pantoea ananatis]